MNFLWALLGNLSRVFKIMLPEEMAISIFRGKLKGKKMRVTGGAPLKWSATAKGKDLTQVLPKETVDLLNKTLNFKGGLKIVKVEAGVKNSTLTTLKELNQNQAKIVNQQIANILGLDSEAVTSAVVIPRVGSSQSCRTK